MFTPLTKTIILFFKSQQGSLFDAPTTVHAHTTRAGTFVAEHQATRHHALKKPKHPISGHLNLQSTKPEPAQQPQPKPVQQPQPKPEPAPTSIQALETNPTKTQRQYKHQADELNSKESKPQNGTAVGDIYKKNSYIKKFVVVPAISFRNQGTTTFTCEKKLNIPPEFSKALTSIIRSLDFLLLPQRDLEIRFVPKNMISGNKGEADATNVEIATIFLKNWIKAGINDKDSAIEFIELLCHELTHVYQYRSGMLTRDDFWEGKDCSEYQSKKWASRPWEQHAVKMQGILAKRVIDNLVGQRIMDASMILENNKTNRPNIAMQQETTEPLKKACCVMIRPAPRHVYL